LNAEPMAAAVEWLDTFRRFWSASFDELDALLEQLKSSEAKRDRDA
jgi:hypothetical protein